MHLQEVQVETGLEAKLHGTGRARVPGVGRVVLQVLPQLHQHQKVLSAVGTRVNGGAVLVALVRLQQLVDVPLVRGQRLRIDKGARTVVACECGVRVRVEVALEILQAQELLLADRAGPRVPGSVGNDVIFKGLVGETGSAADGTGDWPDWRLALLSPFRRSSPRRHTPLPRLCGGRGFRKTLQRIVVGGLALLLLSREQGVRLS